MWRWFEPRRRCHSLYSIRFCFLIANREELWSFLPKLDRLRQFFAQTFKSGRINFLYNTLKHGERTYQRCHFSKAWVPHVQSLSFHAYSFFSGLKRHIHIGRIDWANCHRAIRLSAGKSKRLPSRLNIGRVLCKFSSLL